MMKLVKSIAKGGIALGTVGGLVYGSLWLGVGIGTLVCARCLLENGTDAPEIWALIDDFASCKEFFPRVLGQGVRKLAKEEEP